MNRLPTHFITAFNVFFFLCALSGLLYQEYQLSSVYFQYPISTKVDISIPDLLEAQAITLCIRYPDILDFDRLSRMRGREGWSYKKIMNGDLASDNFVRFVQDNMTIGEIIEYTPNVNTVLTKAAFRRRNSYEVTYLDTPEKVYQHFYVKKYVYLEYVCYSINKTHVTEQMMPYVSVSMAPVWSSVISDFSFSHVLKRAEYLKLVIHVTDPYQSLQVSPIIKRYYNESDGQSKFSIFDTYQTMFVVTILPAPYETNCFDYSSKLGYKSQLQCSENCLKQEILNTSEDKVPFTYITHDDDLNSMNKYLISYIDVMDYEQSNALFNAEKKCSTGATAPCKHQSCNSRVSATKVQEIPSEKFSIRHTIPQEPWVSSTAVPVMSLKDFFTYASSILATYTGFSCLFSMNLSRVQTFLLSFQEKRRRETRITSLQSSSSSSRSSIDRQPGYNKLSHQIKQQEITLHRLLISIFLQTRYS